MQSKIKTSKPRYLIEKSLRDMEKLRFYEDKEYKNSTYYHHSSNQFIEQYFINFFSFSNLD